MDETTMQNRIKQLNEDIQNDGANDRLIRERAQLYLMAGAFNLARADLDMIRHHDIGGGRGPCKPGRLRSDLEINGIGVTYWMEGHFDLAVSHWRYVVDLHILGRVAYSDSGVGVRAGLLLWFGATNRKSREDVERVESHFRKKSQRKFSLGTMARISGAPARYFLRQINEDQLLAEAKGSENGRRQYLCEAHFAMAVRSREEGRHQDYYRLLKLAAPEGATLRDYYNMWEFYLARHETASKRDS